MYEFVAVLARLTDNALDDRSTLIGETYNTILAALSGQKNRADVMPRRGPKMQRKGVAASAIRGFDCDQHDGRFLPRRSDRQQWPIVPQKAHFRSRTEECHLSNRSSAAV
jgi:hypothetical protein